MYQAFVVQFWVRDFVTVLEDGFGVWKYTTLLLQRRVLLQILRECRAAQRILHKTDSTGRVNPGIAQSSAAAKKFGRRTMLWQPLS
jgi:hypothetical protein